MTLFSRRALFFLCLTGLAAGSLRAAPAAGETGAPRAKFSELVFDFGQVMPSAIQKHEFVVTNEGATPLVISRVEPGCGCTTAGAWDREIPPGKSGKIPIQFDPQNFSGRIAKAISVTCNDPTQPSPVLEVRATVWRPFAVEPAFVAFLPVEGDSTRETKVVRLVNNLEATATLELTPPANPRFTAELKAVRPGREFELHVTYDPTGASSDLNASIAIKTSHPDQPTLNVTAFAMPQPAVAVIPTSIQLPAGRLDASYSFNLVIRSNGHEPLKVTDPATNLAGAVVRVTEGEAGKLYYVNLSCPEGFKPPADAIPVLTVKTSHPKFREIRVPVTQAAAAAASGTASK